MIRLENLSMGFRTRRGYKQLFRDVNLTLPTGRSVALLGRNGAGKSTLLQIIAGSVEPTGGRVVSDGTISWPVGFGGSFNKNMTGAQNIRFIARVYGVDTTELLNFVAEFAELGAHFHMPVRSYSSGMKSRLTFGASMGIQFDTYLVDEVTAVGDKSFRERSAEVFKARMTNSSAIVVSHSMGQIKQLCDAAVVLERGEMTWYEDVERAIAVHEGNMDGDQAA
ncbi:ABC transporter ATP-binding protein [Psychromarinibacter halotolerans]|uniref:ABC transporter ATP-binding protein n=1 Tax=Psychromarinibacter halotolerans TaxID=1775175 RepID=A0ABV7GHX2_9RHOB|nr:ABC transporter ATP-binding protein [Psychromarinibacter halotolerans]MDF0598905.1 ABC transporter ATP-binding protein [Psychromarinibacter halotolerans]